MSQLTIRRDDRATQVTAFSRALAKLLSGEGERGEREREMVQKHSEGSTSNIEALIKYMIDYARGHQSPHETVTLRT